LIVAYCSVHLVLAVSCKWWSIYCLSHYSGVSDRVVTAVQV